jgi:hypothetical protein
MFDFIILILLPYFLNGMLFKICLVYFSQQRLNRNVPIPFDISGVLTSYLLEKCCVYIFVYIYLFIHNKL